jgi:hypothetical protein
MYPPGTPANQPRPHRRRLAALPVLAALLVVLLGGVIGWALVSGNGTNGQPTGHSAAGGPGSTAARTGGSAPNSAPAGSGPVTHGRPTAQQLADAITNYFQVVPGDLTTGWSLLTRHFQQTRAQGWASYRDYWNGVHRVDVTSVSGQPPHTVTASLVYHYKNGQVVEQTTTFTMQRQGGVLKIAAES